MKLHIKLHKFVGPSLHFLAFHNQIAAGPIMIIFDLPREAFLPGSENLANTSSDTSYELWWRSLMIHLNSQNLTNWIKW